MAFKPYLVPILGLQDNHTYDSYKPATDLSQKRERNARHAFRGRLYRDLTSVSETKKQNLPYKKNPLEHKTEKKLPMVQIPWFPISATMAEKIAERALWSAVANRKPIDCFANSCGFSAPNLDQLRWHLNEQHNIQYLGRPSRGLKDCFGTTLKGNQNGKSFQRLTTTRSIIHCKAL